jgi:predicted ATPase/DNA-binding CsgD family transcriptional regulator
VLEFIGAKRVLLLLDNFEQVVDAAPIVNRLLREAPNVKILVTTRIVLGIYGERDFPVPPLGLPPADSGRLTAEQAIRYEAVELFVDRARAVQSKFALTDENAPLVVDICRRLDGLPLAIELAAARARVLSVEQIAGRLDQRFDLLRTTEPVPPRQRALATAIAWSYDLLEEAEAELFRRLGVFVGWFDLAAVEAVSGAPAALDLLESLARQSLIVVEHDPATRSARYRLLESLAEYARDALAAHGEATEVAARHAGYYIALARSLVGGLRGAGQAARLTAFDREHDNLVAALEWSLTTGQADDAVGLAALLGEYWRLRGQYTEGIVWLERALAREPDAVTPARLEALNQLGLLLFHTTRLDDARQTLTRTIALARGNGNIREEARASATLGRVLQGLLELEASAASHESALSLFQACDDRAGAALSRHYLGNLANLRGDHPAAERAYREAWSLVQGAGDLAAEAHILSNLGEISARMGHYRRALDYYERSRVKLRALADPDRLAVVAANIAEVQLVLGDAASALSLAAKASEQFRAIGNLAHLAGNHYVHGAALAAVGRRAEALALLRESLDLYFKMGDWIDVVYAAEAIVRLLAAGPDAAHAARILGALDVIREREAIADYPLFDTAGMMTALRSALSADELAARRADGRDLSPVELVAEAILVGNIVDGEPVRMLVSQRPNIHERTAAGTLTSRQIDVLRLVAQGKSNREIGHELAISDRTVERHLTAIFGALEVDRRSAAVARASALGVIKSR